MFEQRIPVKNNRFLQLARLRYIIMIIVNIWKVQHFLLENEKGVASEWIRNSS